MTNEEAIRRIRIYRELINQREPDSPYVEAFDLAEDALQTRIPMPPIWKKGEIESEYYCPVCGEMPSDEGAEVDYCENCGQAISWGGDDDDCR